VDSARQLASHPRRAISGDRVPAFDIEALCVLFGLDGDREVIGAREELNDPERAWSSWESSASL